jgi:hypothetical protein
MGLGKIRKLIKVSFMHSPHLPLRCSICKLVILLVVFTLCHFASTAQEGVESSHKMGLRLGLNHSHMNFRRGYLPPRAVPLETEWRTGITTGFLLHVRLGEKIFIQPEYIYTVKKSYIKDSQTIKLAYLSLPLLLNYKIASKLSLLGGPQFDLLINGKRIRNGATENITHDTEERNLSASIGLEYEVTRLLSLEARYLHGLIHVGIGQRSNVVEFKYEELQMRIGINF